ncbi:helix-turn-helix domain-containing protein [Variovorax terrae]|uniref:AraC family transcriptional regulator n=1 Tax=Variovorax terrae TaxID=2923278 RepID=A0A9X1VWW0_9BURK|nr:AraC family transcriptional regulator [Variovorax terrae]MCJ0764907.1 AraC family transcriptional regulator [Variovorax terrae]
MRASMWLNADRVLYVGLLGTPSLRTFGSYTLYVSLGAAHRISFSGEPWQAGWLSIVPPGVPHRIAGSERMIATLLIEPETVSHENLPAFLRNRRGTLEEPRLLVAMHRELDAIRNGRPGPYERTTEFDMAFFGAELVSQALDPRIRAVLNRMKSLPQCPYSARECADSICVSASRFLHLFKEDIGVPFRNFRAWKRARSLLHHVKEEESLTNIALDAGYPDSTHFSHTIRTVYGLTPRSILVGCRQLKLHHAPAL